MEFNEGILIPFEGLLSRACITVKQRAFASFKNLKATVVLSQTFLLAEHILMFGNGTWKELIMNDNEDDQL